MPTMKAARLHEIGGKFQIDEVQRPEPRQHDVLVKVGASGVVPNLKNVTTHFPTWYPFLPLPALPAIFGLDTAGTVTAVGSSVSSFKPGDRVYVNPGVGCGECRYCRLGQVARCDDYTFMGYFGFGSGSQEIFKKYPYAGYSEYMTAPVTNLVRLPDQLSLAQATRFGYLGTAYSGLKKSGLCAGQTILILGASGTLGVGTTLLALALGASRVVVAARQLSALARLKELDPQRVEVVAVGSRPVSEIVRELVPGGVDVMVDTLGAKAPAALSVDAMRAVARGGRIIQIGGVAGPIPIDPHPFMCAQLQYIGSLWFSSVEGDEMASMIASGLLDLSIIEGRPYRLEQLDQALDDIEAHGDGFTNYHILHD